MTRVIEIRRAGGCTVIGTLSIKDADLRGQDGKGRLYVRLGGVPHDVYFDGSRYYIYQ